MNISRNGLTLQPQRGNLYPMTQTPASFIGQLPRRALVRLTGEDWRSFLQGLITQDVETLRPGEIRFGALLSPQGRLLHDLFIVGLADGVWLDVEADQRAALIQRLKLYKLRARVEVIADETPVLAAFPDPEGPDWYRDPRLATLGSRGYGLIGSPGDVSEAYDAHRLSLGVSGPGDWGHDKTYPIEANFDLLSGIDFKKGCFVGQETTSRMKRRGVIKSRMLAVHLEGPLPPEGSEVLAGELRAGEILTGLGTRAMALMRLDRIERPLTVNGQPARVEVPEWLS